jgi:5'-nucleotidase
MTRLRASLEALDGKIAPLARRGGEILNQRWGLLMRAGNDKSHLARQVERFADIYTSRVSNFLFETPFVYLRAPRGSLPHDATPLVG